MYVSQVKSSQVCTSSGTSLFSLFTVHFLLSGPSRSDTVCPCVVLFYLTVTHIPTNKGKTEVIHVHVNPDQYPY